LQFFLIIFPKPGLTWIGPRKPSYLAQKPALEGAIAAARIKAQDRVWKGAVPALCF